MKQSRLHLRVYGTVQGVGFRWFAQRAARSADLAGYVLNRADGTVELEAEGGAEDLHRFRRTVENGPPGAHVARVDELPPTDEPLARPFHIRH